MELQEQERAPQRIGLVSNRDEVAGTLAVDPGFDAREHAFGGAGAEAPQQVQADVHEHLFGVGLVNLPIMTLDESTMPRGRYDRRLVNLKKSFSVTWKPSSFPTRASSSPGSRRTAPQFGQTSISMPLKMLVFILSLIHISEPTR